MWVSAFSTREIVWMLVKIWATQAWALRWWAVVFAMGGAFGWLLRATGR